MDAQVPKSTVIRDSLNLNSPLHSTDRLLIAFWCFLALVSLAFHSRIQLWWGIIASDIVAFAIVWVLARADQNIGSRALRWIHDWAAFPLVVFTYKQIYYMIRPIHLGKDYDRLLIALDRALFHVNPTEWLARFSTPSLTEILQIAYSLFYVLFVAIGFELYRDRDLSRFRFFRFTIAYGFLISYIGYFFLPAVGPRFTLHDFSKTNAELPGLLFTPALRLFVNFFESIPAGVSNSVTLACAQRDVFPSGHTMMAIIVMVVACRYRLKVRGAVFLVGILLIFATVYLRYHYVVDIAAGSLLALICLLTAGKAHAIFRHGSSD
jgi:membrane-associated phospholipid phosphatase